MNVAVDSRTRQVLGDLSVIRAATGFIEISIDEFLTVKLTETQALSFGLALTEIALGKM